MNESSTEAPQEPRNKNVIESLLWGSLAIILGLRAIVSESLWWTLAKGEAVVKGTFHPSANLLYESKSYDADWLGGLPAFLFHLILDIPGLAILRMLYVVGFIFLIRHLRNENPNLKIGVIWFLASITGISMLTAFDPTPIANELFLAAGLTYFAFRKREITLQNGWLEIFIITVAWANMGAHSIYAIPIVLASVVKDFENGTRKLTAAIPFLAVFIGLLVTPRGMLGFYDSLIQTYPQLFYENALLMFDQWKPLLARDATIEFIAFVLLSAFTCLQLLLSRSSVSLAALWILLQWTAWNCSGNMAIVSIIQMMLVFQIWNSEQSANRENIGFNSLRTSNSKPVALLGIGMSILLLLAITPGYKTEKDSRIGFGIAPHLSLNELQEEIQKLQVGGTAHCGDIRSAGMLAWIRPGTIQPTTTPTKALIDGQLRDYVSLNQEFALGWRLFHPRNDGTAGGWYLRIKDRPIQMVMFSYENIAVARQMIPTVWKPMSIVSATIPYGHTNQKICSACSDPILDTIESQVKLLASPYSLDPKGADFSSQYIDIWGLISGQANLQDDLTQCRFLTAMEKYSSSARLLGPVLKKYQTPEVYKVLLESEEEQAINERVNSGEASLFRTLLVKELKRRTGSDGVATVFEDLGWDKEDDSEIREPMMNAIELLLKGDFSNSLNALPKESENPEIQFARAVLMIYSGRFNEGISLFTTEFAREKHSKISILSDDIKTRATDDYLFLRSMNLIN